MFPNPWPEFSEILGILLWVPISSQEFSRIISYSSPECSGNLCNPLSISVPSPDFFGIVPFPTTEFSSWICFFTNPIQEYFVIIPFPNPEFSSWISVLFLFPDRSFPGCFLFLIPETYEILFFAVQYCNVLHCTIVLYYISLHYNKTPCKGKNGALRRSYVKHA